MTIAHKPSLNAPLDRVLLQRATMHREAQSNGAGAHVPGDPHVFTILVATDFSTDSDDVVALAARVGAPMHARFVLLHVLPRANGPDFPASPAVESDRKQQALAKMSAITSALRHVIRNVPFEVRLRNDCAHLGIVREASEVAADLIVIARHGCSADDAGHLGRTADYVIRHAPCPVLLASENGG